MKVRAFCCGLAARRRNHHLRAVDLFIDRSEAAVAGELEDVCLAHAGQVVNGGPEEEGGRREVAEPFLWTNATPWNQ